MLQSKSIFIYCVTIFLSSLLLTDLNVIPLLNIGPTLYISDIFFIFFFYCLGVLLFLRKRILLNKYFTYLLIILFFSLLYGATKFGFRSIGEGRYIYWLFFAFAPVFFYYSGLIKTMYFFDKFSKLTYQIVIINVLFLFILEIINGGRIFIAPQNDELVGLEDSVRGRRFLGSEDTFHLGVSVVFLIINQMLAKKKRTIEIVLIIGIAAIIFFTKNRTALGSILFGLVAMLLIESKLKLVLKIAGLLLIVFGIVFLIFPDIFKSIIDPLLSAINIQEDETGNWRLLVQAVAIEDGMKTPIIGQGFGGYFEYYVPEMNQTFNFPPHSIYVLLFQKCGLLGLTAYIASLIAIIRDIIKLKKYSINDPIAEKYRLVLLILFLAQIPYGFAYGFSVYMGLYVGMLAVLRKILVSTNTASSNELYIKSNSINE